MNQLFRFLLLKLFLFGTLSVFGQNCGLVDSVQTSASSNGNGTTDYTFTCHLSTTSGGGKSVAMTIYCAVDTFIKDTCELTNSTPSTVVYGPYTITTCTTQIYMDWYGYTNSTCGGSACINTANVPVPVRYISYNIYCEEGRVWLKWETADEQDNAGFEIQRRNMDGSWETFANVEGNNEFGLHSYSLDITGHVFGVSYVRLKQLDYNGVFLLSKPIEVSCSKEFISFYPNPATDEIHFSALVEHYRIYDQMGKEILRGEDCMAVDVRSLKSGVYIILVDTGYREERMKLIR